jgi:hypothetical protein
VFHNLSHKDAADTESGALIYQNQQYIFSVSANGGYTPQIDDELTMVPITQSFLANALQLVAPGRNELTFQDHSALVIALDNGNSQHLSLPISGCNRHAKCGEDYLTCFQ